MNPILTTIETSPGPRSTTQPAAPVVIQRVFVIRNVKGLHCMAATYLAKTLDEFNCKATVRANGQSADGKSIMSLLGLAAGFGSKLTFELTGPGAPLAMQALERLFESNFIEVYRKPNDATKPGLAGVTGALKPSR